MNAPPLPVRSRPYVGNSFSRNAGPYCKPNQINLHLLIPWLDACYDIYLKIILKSTLNLIYDTYFILYKTITLKSILNHGPDTCYSVLFRLAWPKQNAISLAWFGLSILNNVVWFGSAEPKLNTFGLLWLGLTQMHLVCFVLSWTKLNA